MLPNMATLEIPLPVHQSLGNMRHPDSILYPRRSDLWGLHCLGPCFGSAGSVKAEGQPQMGLMAFFRFPPCSWVQLQFSFCPARQACESVKVFFLIQNRIPLKTRPLCLVQYQPLSTEGNRKTRGLYGVLSHTCFLTTAPGSPPLAQGWARGVQTQQIPGIIYVAVISVLGPSCWSWS